MHARARISVLRVVSQQRKENSRESGPPPRAEKKLDRKGQNVSPHERLTAWTESFLRP